MIKLKKYKIITANLKSRIVNAENIPSNIEDKLEKFLRTQHKCSKELKCYFLSFCF